MSYVDIFNTDPIQDLFAGIIPNSVMVADNESTIQGLSMKSGEILIGDTGKIPNVATLQGTPKQVSIDYLLDLGNRVLKFSLPQDLDIDSNPTFNKVTADTVDTKSLIIDGSEIDFTKYVTIDTKQTVTATKTFSQDVTFGTTDFGQIRFSTYDNGRNRIASGWTTDSDYFMEFYVRNVKTMELRNGYPGSGRDREVTMPGLVRTGLIVPTSGKTHDIGSSTQPYRSLYLGNDTGIISLGHNIRGSGRAELHLHSIGDDFSWIFFGKDARTDANSKWVLGSSPSTQDDTFRLWRATGLSGGAFSEVIDVVGSGANAGQTRFRTTTDSINTSTGSAVFSGGVGIAKNLNAARMIVPRGTGVIDARFNGSQPELYLNSDGDGISQLSFGSGPAESTNTKWAISSRASGSNNEGLRVYRGPKLAGGWDQILQIDGTGADAGRVIFNKTDPSTSTTSGAVQIRGGLGVAGAIHAGSINVASINVGAPDKRLLLSSTSTIGWSNSTFVDSMSSTVLGSDAGYHQPTVPDPTGLDTYMANSNTVYGATAGYTTIKATSRNSYFGERAGVGIGHNYNTVMGYRALDSGTSPGGPTCNNNTVVGAQAMNKTSTGELKVSYNTAIGVAALRELKLGSRNTAVGWGTGQSMTESFACVFIGYQAGLASLDGNNRIAIGSMAAVGQDNWCQIGSTGSPMTLTVGMYGGGRIGTPEQPINEINATTINVSTMSLPQTTVVTPHNMRLHMTESKSGVLWTLLPSGTYNGSGVPGFIFSRMCNTVTLTCTGPSFGISTGTPKTLRLTEFIPVGYRPVAVFKFPVFLRVADYYPAQGVCTIDSLGTIQIDIIYNPVDMPRDHFWGEFNEVNGFSFSYNIYPYMAV